MQRISQIEIYLKEIDKNHKVKNFKNVLSTIISLKDFTCNTSNVDEFPFKDIFNTEAYGIIIVSLTEAFGRENKLMNNHSFAEIKKNISLRESLDIEDQIIHNCLVLISNIMLSSKPYIELMINSNILEILSTLLDLTKIKRVKSIFWSMANLLVESPECKGMMISKGFVDFLTKNDDVLTEDKETKETICWFISNFFRDKPSICPVILKLLLRKYIICIESNVNSDCVIEILTAINDFLDVHNRNFDNRVEFIFSFNITERLLELLPQPDYLIQITVLNIIGKLTSIEGDFSFCFLTQDTKEILIYLIKKGCQEVIMKSLWIISNLQSCPNQGWELLCTRDIIHLVLEALETNQDNQDLVFDGMFLLKCFLEGSKKRHTSRDLMNTYNFADIILRFLGLPNIILKKMLLNFFEVLIEISLEIYEIK